MKQGLINVPDKKEKLISFNDIKIFKESPSSNHFRQSVTEEKLPDAADLFAHFTADIIKQNVTFTR